MDHYFNKFDSRGREKGNNWKLGLRFPPPGNELPPRIPSSRNNDFSRLPRDNYPFQDHMRSRNYERYHYYNPVRHRMFMPHHSHFDNIRLNYKEPYRTPIAPSNHNYFSLDIIGDEEHNFSPPSNRGSPNFHSNYAPNKEEFNNPPSTSHSYVSNENKVQTVSRTTEKDTERKTPQLNPEAARKEALAAELRKSLQKFQKTHSQSRNKLSLLDKSNQSGRPESSCETQTCFQWDLPLTVDDLKSIGRGKTGNIEVCADSCSENELNSLEMRNNFHHSDNTGESTNETSPEIQVLKQIRKRKVSESIDIVNKKKKPKNLESRRRHRSASPSVREEAVAEDTVIVEKDGNPSSSSSSLEKQCDRSKAVSLKLDTSRRPRPKPSLMDLLGVRRREFSEMVDHPKNPKVQFMLNLLMKRHKELLSQRSLRSRFSVVNGKTKARKNLKEKEHNGVQKEVQCSDDSLRGTGASDAIDELTNILLESSLTVDISSLPQELIEKLGDFLEMGVDFCGFSDDLTTEDELEQETVRQIEEIQQEANNSLMFTDLVPEKDTLPSVSESSETNHGKDSPHLKKKESPRRKKVQKRSPERVSPHARRKALVKEETSPRKENVVSVNSCNSLLVDNSHVDECDKLDSPHTSAEMIGDEREKNCTQSIVAENITTPSKSKDRRIDSPHSSAEMIGDERENSCTQSIVVENITTSSKSNDRSIDSKQQKDNPTIESSSVTEVSDPNVISNPNNECVSQISLNSSLCPFRPSDPESEECTEEKLLSKMWDIDVEIGKLMEKKQQLYLKLTQLRNLRQIPKCTVSSVKDSIKSVERTLSKEFDSRSTDLNRFTITDKVLNKNSQVISISEPSSSNKHSTKPPKQTDNCAVAFKNGNDIKKEVTVPVQLSESVKKVCDSDLSDNNIHVEQLNEVPNPGNVSNKSKDFEKEVKENSNPKVTEKGSTNLNTNGKTVLAIKVHKNFLYAACADFAVYCFSLQTMGIKMHYTGHTNTVTCLYIDVDNLGVPKLFTGSHDGSVRIFNPRTGSTIQSFSLDEKVTCMEASWGILHIGTKEGNILRFHLPKSTFMEQKLSGFKSEVMAIQASKEGPRKVLIVALRDKPIVVRDASTGLLLRSINESTEKHVVYAIHVVHGLVYAGSSIYGLTAWDLTSGKRVQQYEDCGSIVAVHVQNGKIYAASYDGNIYLYDCGNPKPEHIIRASNKMLLCLELRHNKIYVGSLDKKLQIWKSPYKVRSR